MLLTIDSNLTLNSGEAVWNRIGFFYTRYVSVGSTHAHIYIYIITHVCVWYSIYLYIGLMTVPFATMTLPYDIYIYISCFFTPVFHDHSVESRWWWWWWLDPSDIFLSNQILCSPPHPKRLSCREVVSDPTGSSFYFLCVYLVHTLFKSHR